MSAKDEQRKPLAGILQTVYPSLLQLLTALSAHDTTEAGEMQKLIIKIIEVTTKISIPPFFAEPQTIDSWMVVLIAVLEKPIPVSVNSHDDEAGKHPLWKVKKWTARVMERFMKRYARTNDNDEPANKQFIFSTHQPLFLFVITKYLIIIYNCSMRRHLDTW